MKTIHTPKNCKYRQYLIKKKKEGKISGRFYKFLCRNFPYRLTQREVQCWVNEVITHRIKESSAINIINTKHKDLIKRQAEMYQSNIECMKKTNNEKNKTGL